MSYSRVLRHLVIGLAAVSSFSLMAQSNAGQISGTVVDPAKAVIDGVAISAANIATNVTQKATARDELSAKSKELTLMMLLESEYPFSRRQFTPGHITCTAVVLDPRRTRVLLMFHHRLLRWLLPGGHCENDDLSISSVAGREAVEETGVAIDPYAEAPLVGIDVHGIPPKKKEPYHLHHDLIFAFTSRSDAVQVTEEARRVEWCPPADLARFEVADSIVRSVRRAITGKC